MGKLAYHRVYLCGGMETCPNGGEEWRDAITPWLQSLGLLVYNPAKKPIDTGWEDSVIRKRVSELKSIENWNAVSAIYKKIRQIDLRMVDVTDFMIVYLDLNLTLCGTYEEIFLANRHKHPILLCCPQGKENIPNWLFGTIRHEEMFNTIDEIKIYLQQINSGLITDNERWQFFNHQKPLEDTNLILDCKN